MTAKAEVHEEVVQLPPLALSTIEITVVGDSPLISHAWSSKAKQMMLDKQTKKARGAREAKDPEADFFDSLYWISEKPAKPTMASLKTAKFGIPAVQFKLAAVNACSHVDGVTKVAARGAFHVIGDMVEIHGLPTMREDMVRIHMGTADIRYRGQFETWRATFRVRYNKNVLSSGQIVNLFNTAGFAIGVGDWRPQKNGSYGMFHVATKEDG